MAARDGRPANVAARPVGHRGWEALTQEQVGEDCALPGGYSSGAYASGWARILGCFAAFETGPAHEEGITDER